MQHSTASSRSPKGPQGSSILTSSNTTPLGSRRRLTSSAAPATAPLPALTDEEWDAANPSPVPDPVPEVWKASITALMRRTTAALDLVLAYHRDAHGGQRWAPAHVEEIRAIGAQLHPEIRALKQAARALPDETAGDYGARRWAVLEMAEGVRVHCERVLCAISEREAPCLPVDDTTGDIYTSTGEVYDAAGRYVGVVAPEEYARKGLFFA
ncbi:hypothetical protein IQ07DRAFT_640948 [Pyrenochaeta sp. DS3sAY3a]|nr:hypothetical protein IQ07DRAFT_640948 [Pyrenochaeta sp. DS3sAY3a]